MMSKKFIGLTILTLLYTFSLIGQSCSYDKSLPIEANLCDFYRVTNFVPDKNAEIALNKILSVISIAKRFVLLPCDNINNCVATTYKGVRYIIYDKYFINEISTKNDSWVQISILAHEVGHHINGHSLDIIMHAADVVDVPSLAESRKMELEADEFSGFVMSKLGASLQQAQEAVNFLSSNSDDTHSTHPSRNKRLAAIEKGYNRGLVPLNQEKINTNLSLQNYDDFLYAGMDDVMLNNSISAIENLTKAININPNHSMIYFYRSIAYHKLNQTQLAFDDISKSILMDPDNSTFYNWRGSIYEYNYEHKNAIKDFMKAISIDSFYSDAHANIADSYLSLNNYKLALSYINKSIQLNTSDAYYYFIRGRIYVKLGDYFQAITNFKNSILFEPDEDSYYIYLGNAYSDVKKYDMALQNLKKAAKINPNNDYTYHSLGNLYYKNKHFQTAISYFKKAIIIRPSSGSYMMIALCYDQQNNFSSAISYYNKSIELDPKNSEAYYNRAIVKFKLNDRYGACKDLSIAGELGVNEAYRVINSECK